MGGVFMQNLPPKTPISLEDGYSQNALSEQHIKLQLISKVKQSLLSPESKRLDPQNVSANSQPSPTIKFEQG